MSVTDICVVAENLPSLTVEIQLSITNTASSRACRQALEASATTLSVTVTRDVHTQLQTGVLCNASIVGHTVLLLLQRNTRLSLVDTEVGWVLRLSCFPFSFFSYFSYLAFLFLSFLTSAILLFFFFFSYFSYLAFLFLSFLTSAILLSFFFLFLLKLFFLTRKGFGER